MEMRVFPITHYPIIYFVSPAQGFFPAQGSVSSTPVSGLVVLSAPWLQETTPIDKRDTAASMAIYLTFMINYEFPHFVNYLYKYQNIRI